MKYIIILTLLSLLSCQNKTTEENNIIGDKNIDQPKSVFETYTETLDIISLPLTLSSTGLTPNISKNFDLELFDKYKHKWASQPLGIYYKDDKTIGIIDISIGDWGPVPFLTTFDLDGNKIDSTGFYFKSGWDMGYEGIEHMKITENRSIIVIDTVKIWEINEDGSDILEETMTLNTGKITYHILENGQIEVK